MKVYISGKIGEVVISEATRLKFAKAEEMLKAKGYEVFNPCDERWQNTLKREYENDQYVKSPWLTDKFPDFYAYALLRDMMVLSTKDAIYVLQDWERSPGSETEVRFAMATGKAFLCQKRQEAKSYLWDKWWDEEYDKFINDDDANGTCDDEVDRYINQHLEEIWLPL
jgi:hypothetical protein